MSKRLPPTFTRPTETTKTEDITMSVKSFREALNEAMRDEMRRDPTVILLGEDNQAVWDRAVNRMPGAVCSVSPKD